MDQKTHWGDYPVDAQALLAAIVATSDDAIVSKSLDGAIRSWNQGAQRIFGYAPEEVIGQSISIIIPPDRSAEEPEILRRIQQGERVDHFETVRQRKDGTLIDVSVTISPLRDSAGKIVGASKIARDITVQKQFQRELQAAKVVAEAASRAKDRFLSVLSHELRTPLTPLLSVVALLEKRAAALPSHEMEEYISIIRRNVETEARLVDDLLDLTRIAQGKVGLHFEVVDMHAAIKNVCNMLETDLQEKDLKLIFRPDAGDHEVWADPGRMQQIFLNLLSNAVKFTPAGGSIEILTSNRDGMLRVEVKDSGIGLTEDIQGRLFEAFEQGEVTIARQFGGLGLGLSIVRSLLTLHGGEISAFSAGRDRGATFTIVMPIASSQQKSAQAAGTARTVSPCRILLVEDHTDTRTILARLLISLGYDVVTAGSVKEAIRVADRDRFDILVSDIGLPDGSGTEVMSHLRERHPTQGIALSGFGQEDDVRRSMAAGFARHLIKPVTFEMLRGTIEELVA